MYATLKLWNRNSKSKKESIIVYYSAGGIDYRHSTGVKIHPDNWSESKSIIKQKEGKDVDTLNQKIKAELDKVNSTILDYIKVHNIKPSVGILKQAIKAYSPQSIKKNTVLEFYEEFLETRKKDKNIASASNKDYISLKKALEEFSSSSSYPLTFDALCKYYPFCSDFIEFLIDERDQSNKTINKRLSCLKTFLHYSEKNLGIKLDKSDLERFKVSNHPSEFVVLTKEEIHFFKDLDLSFKPNWAITRDLFIVLCYTSMRYSDLVTLGKEDIKNGNQIDKISVKTKIRFRVGINKTVKSILNKYNFNLNIYTNKQINENLKELSKYIAENYLPSLSESFKFTKWQGKESKKVERPRWDDISSHTGRRSFITLAIMHGVPINKIMDMSGHRKIDTLMIYLDRYGNNDNNFVNALDS